MSPDSSYSVYHYITWPRCGEKDFVPDKNALKKYSSLGKGYAHKLSTEELLYHLLICPDDGESMHLYMLKNGTQMSIALQEQVEDTVRICANLWGKGHLSIVIRELIRSIIQDDPLKMRRLSEMFHIDILSVHDMWIVECKDRNKESILKEKSTEICEMLSSCTSLQFGDWYENRLMLFSSHPDSLKEVKKVWDEIFETFGNALGINLVWCHGLQTTTDVREAYQCYLQYFVEVRKIFPYKKVFSYGDIQFAKDCSEKIKEGEASVQPYLDCLKQLKSCSEEWDAIEMAASYLLDNDASITKTSNMHFLHKNTIKYRLKVMEDALGYLLNKMPDGWQLYQSVAIHRLIS